MENDVGMGLFEGFFQRRILFFAQIGGDIFGAGDNTSEREAGLGIGGDVIGDGFGPLVIADDDGTEGGFTTMFESEIASKANNAAENAEEEKTGDGGIDGHNADWKKVKFEEEIDGNDSHHADERGAKEAGNFGPAAAAEENGLFIEAEAGENDEVDWDEGEHGKDEATGVGGEVEGALIEVGAHEIGHQKGEDDREGVPQNEEDVEDHTKIPFHKYIIS